MGRARPIGRATPMAAQDHEAPPPAALGLALALRSTQRSPPRHLALRQPRHLYQCRFPSVTARSGMAIH